MVEVCVSRRLWWVCAVYCYAEQQGYIRVEYSTLHISHITAANKKTKLYINIGLYTLSI